MTIDFQAAAKKFGSINHDGMAVAMTQQPYMRTNGSAQYEAAGMDADGAEYLIRWDTTDGADEREDESTACDWTAPVEVVAL